MSKMTNGDRYSAFLHDAVMLYAVAINSTINRGMNVRSGSDVAFNMRGKTFRGLTGMVVLDDNGDREPDYWITDMAPNGTFVKIAEVLNTDDGTRYKWEFRKNIRPPMWPNGKVGHEFAPPDTPVCGFMNELCPEHRLDDWLIILIIILSLVVLGSAVGLGVFIFKRQAFENNLLAQSWRINWNDIESVKGYKSGKLGSTPTLNSNSKGSSNNLSERGPKAALDSSLAQEISKMSSQSRSMPSIGTGTQLFAEIGLLNGVIVAIKNIKKEHMQITRIVLLEFNEMKNLIHDNLNVFVGAVVDPEHICLIWHYCPKGSLQDVLADDSIKLDGVFKMSFITDIAKGIHYLHNSHLGSHGNLKTSNCLLDGRWTVKITDYGMTSFLTGQDFQENEDDTFRRKLWTAPEILRENFPPPRGTQKGDIYSFSIVCYEILMRSEPYNFDNITPRDVVQRVRNGESVPYRPQIQQSANIETPLVDMVTSMWVENPEQRPTIVHVRNKIKKIAKGEVNILDNILNMMEKYANNLEEIVEERTQQLWEEKKRTDRLLYRMLPQSVADQLKFGKFVEPENFDKASIYFSDIFGFNELASESTPMQIVDFLNDLYTAFDDVIEKHDVFKVETIGDAYMVCSGLPIRNGDLHAAEIANCSLDLLAVAKKFKVRHRQRLLLKLRVGMHTGPVVAGVVGNVMPRYCLFGDTVNTASRMETTGLPQNIHISKPLYILLCEFKVYNMTVRGDINVKGKGLQTTYWLHGRTDLEASSGVEADSSKNQTYHCGQVERDTGSAMPDIV